MNNYYEIYYNKEYLKALEYILEDSEFKIMIDQEYPDYFISNYIDILKNDVIENPEDDTAKNILIFIEKSKFIIESEYGFIFDYYSEIYQKHFYVNWDSEGDAQVFHGNIVSFFDDISFSSHILKPTRLNYIRKCKAIGLKYETADFKIGNEDMYRKENLIKDPYLYAIIGDWYMYYGPGIMDNTYMWEIEDQYCKIFGLKDDSYTFSEIHETGYEEFYLLNREIMKTIDMTKIEINKHISEDKDYLIVLGFMHLKYQLDLPNKIKEDLLILFKPCDTGDYKEKSASQTERDIHLQNFKHCIEKEDGEGLINVGSILPKRTLYE